MVLLNFTRQTSKGYWALDTDNLPGPAHAHEIALFPINSGPDDSTTSANGTAFNPKRIADLMLQILSINWQMGNFHRTYHDPPQQILQLSSEQCARFLQVAKTQPYQSPPFDDAVLEAMCMLPYFSDTNEDYKVVPLTSLITIPEVDRAPDREIVYGSALVPPHMLRLTEWWGGDAGVALFIDTKTGAAVELEDWDTAEGDNEGEVTKFEGKTHPSGEAVLQGWIDKFLNLTWVPDGSSGIFDASRDRHVVFLAHKRLLLKYGWPDAFPLPADRFKEYLEEKDALSQLSPWEEGRPFELAHRWHDAQVLAAKALCEQGCKMDRRNQFLGDTITNLLMRYAFAQMELAYAREAGEAPLPERARLPEIESINAGGDEELESGERAEWSVEVQPIDFLARVAELWHRFPAELQNAQFREVVDVLSELYDKTREKHYPAFELERFGVAASEGMQQQQQQQMGQEEREEL
ncbi:hypothetical protein HDK77DRAFT_275030 [Phyllosticta capitalensis]|uniref:Knr4/Smi1-like domain-containing protein n=1 Tax=Phyllosticta capitalensis TaxID=121624 RepID=A0ABR1YH84_9PEZI